MQSESIQECMKLLEKGIETVSASKAGTLLHTSGPAMILAAKKKMPMDIPVFFSGRNAHFSVRGIIRYLNGGKDLD